MRDILTGANVYAKGFINLICLDTKILLLLKTPYIVPFVCRYINESTTEESKTHSYYSLKSLSSWLLFST